MKAILLLVSFVFLSGCYQTSASLVGPAYTLGSTGNIYQAGLTYASNMAVKKTTGKTPSEHISLYVEEKKEEEKLKKSEAKIKKEMANYLQSHIEIMRDKLNLKNKL